MMGKLRIGMGILTVVRYSLLNVEPFSYVKHIRLLLAA